MNDTPDLQSAIQAAIQDSRRPLAPGEAQPMRPGPRVQVGRVEEPAAPASVARAARRGPGRILRVGPRGIAALLVAVLAAAFAFKLQIYLGALGPGQSAGFGSFDLMRMVGGLGLTGHAAEAYDAARLGAAEAAAGGTAQLWAFPPIFGAFAAALALLPAWIGFALFVGLPMILFLGLVWQLSEGRPAPVLIAVAPALLMAVLSGQGGVMAAVLVGLAAAAMLRGWALAGVPLGLLAAEPHLGLGLALLAVLRRDWWVLKLAVTVALAAAVVSTWVLGPQIWNAFSAGLTAAAGYLPLSRLISAYALTRGAGVAPGVALAVQGGVALVALALLMRAARRGPGLRSGLGFALLAGLLVTPVGLAQDLPVLGIALAVLWPELAPRMARVEALGLGGLAFLACGAGLARMLAVGDAARIETMVRAGQLPLIEAPALLLLLLWATLILRRKG